MARDRKADPNEVLATITPQPARRVAAVGMLGALGAITLSVALARPPQDPLWTIFLVAMGAGAFWLGWSVWRASGTVLELTRVELREAGDGGRVLCSIDNLARVDRGAFAFKPAGGFLAKLNTPMPGVYAPGLWWRRGRTLAVGGVTARREAKEVADLMVVLLVQRDAGAPRP